MSALNLDTYSLSLITAKEDILSDRTSTDWAVFTYEKRWSLKLSDSGVGGLEELTKKLNKNLIQYGLCRVSDPNAGVPRFILIHWVGENVDASRREVTAQHLPSIRKFFKEANVVLGAQRVEDITPELVGQAVGRVPPPARAFQKPRIPGSHELVGTKYMKTNPAVEMKISKREAFWQRSEREEEKRKEMERLRLQEERIALERERVERERLEEEERERRIQEKERLVEEQRKEQARLEAERRRAEKERWVQQQKEYEEELKGRFKRSQSIEMAAEAAALVSSRSLHPRDFFRQQERSVSSSFSPPSTPSSPSKSSSGFFTRTTPRYQRSMTESILTPTSRSPTFFQGFQKRDSFSSVSPSPLQTCSPAFIFSKSPLPGTSPKVDSLPAFIPPPITATRVSPAQVKGYPPQTPHTPSVTGSNDLPFRAEYVTVSQAEHNSQTQEKSQHEDLLSGKSPARTGGLYRAELVPVESPSTSQSEVQELPNKAAKSPTSVTADKPTAIKATVSVSSPTTEVAFTSPALISEVKIPAAPPSPETAVPTLSAAEVTATPTPTALVSLSSALPTHKPTNKTSDINETVLPTKPMLSYEARTSPGSASLVSLLAPTPYRTQRAEISTTRSLLSTAPLGDKIVSLDHLSLETSPTSILDSSEISLENKYPPPCEFPQHSSGVSPVPVSVCPPSGSFPEYQQSMSQATESLPIDVPVTSETSPKPHPSPTQTEVPPVDPVLISVSPLVYNSATTQASFEQVDAPESSETQILPVESSSEIQPNDIQTNPALPQSSAASSGYPTWSSPESEPNNNQSQVSFQSDSPSSNDIGENLLLQSTPISPNIPTETLTELQSYTVQTEIPSIACSSEASALSTESQTESQLNNKHSDIPPSEPSHGSSALSTESSAESHYNIPADISVVEALSQPQANNIHRDTLLVEPSCEPPPITTEDSSGPQVDNNPTDILLVESSCEPPPITTEDSSGPQLDNIQTDTVLVECSCEPPPITTEDSSGPQVDNNPTDILLVESSCEPPPITTGDSSGPQLDNNPTDILLVECSCEPPPITTEDSSGPQVDNNPTDILLVESSSEPPPITTGDSSGPQLNNNPADILLEEPSCEPPPITTDVSFGLQLNNIQADIPLLEPSRELPSITTNEASSGDHLNVHPDIPLLEPPHGSPSITTEVLAGAELHVQADIPKLPLTGSLTNQSSLLPELLTENQSNNIQVVSVSEPPSITTEITPEPQLTNVQADIPFIQSPLVSSSLSTENSSELQPNNIQVEFLTEPPSRTTDSTSGTIVLLESSLMSSFHPMDFSEESHIINNNQEDVLLLESSLICPSNEGSGEPQTNNNREGDLIPESSLICPSHEDSEEPQTNSNREGDLIPELSTICPSHEDSEEPQTHNNQGGDLIPELSTICTSIEGSGEPQTNNNREGDLIPEFSTICPSHEGSLEPNFQADNQLLESSPVLFPSTESSNEPSLEEIQPTVMTLESSPVPPALRTMSSPEPQSNNILADIPLTGSSFLTNEESSESQSNQNHTDITLAELLPISLTIPTESPADIVIEKFSPPPSESSAESPLVQADVPQAESSSSTDTTILSPETQVSHSRSDAESPESTAVSTVPTTESPHTIQANDVQPDSLAQESSTLPFSIPSEVFSELQLSNIEADIPSQEAPLTAPTNNVQTDHSLTESFAVEETSPITGDISTGPLPYQVQEGIAPIDTLLVPSPSSTESTPDFQPSDYNDGDNPLFSISTSNGEESVPHTLQAEVQPESAPVSICPIDNTSCLEGEVDESQPEGPSPLLGPLPEEALHSPSLPACLPSDSSPQSALRSSSPSCDTVYAEKVILVEDPHPGSPPLNGGLIALESTPTINPVDLEVKTTGDALHNTDLMPVHDVLSSSITVDDNSATDPKLIPSCEQRLHKQLNSSAPEALP
ncbi:uncharacterized protein RB166_020953 [Leptodactylus fuscus]|uniref:uncharacterized protein LOC142186433 n=1 Tax=Leptodactylus fuscus TaxID=238119 RepID=UPI003F4ED13C